MCQISHSTCINCETTYYRTYELCPTIAQTTASPPYHHITLHPPPLHNAPFICHLHPKATPPPTPWINNSVPAFTISRPFTGTLPNDQPSLLPFHEAPHFTSLADSHTLLAPYREIEAQLYGHFFIDNPSDFTSIPDADDLAWSVFFDLGPRIRLYSQLRWYPIRGYFYQLRNMAERTTLLAAASMFRSMVARWFIEDQGQGDWDELCENLAAYHRFVVDFWGPLEEEPRDARVAKEGFAMLLQRALRTRGRIWGVDVGGRGVEEEEEDEEEESVTVDGVEESMTTGGEEEMSGVELEVEAAGNEEKESQGDKESQERKGPVLRLRPRVERLDLNMEGVESHTG